MSFLASGSIARVDVRDRHDGAREPGRQAPGRVGEKQMDERAAVEIERGLEERCRGTR